ncbi:MAG: NAD-dependent epimerase/dehydratase family protein [Flavobacteriales bacterium]
MNRAALVAGPTGLIGSTVLHQLLSDDRFYRTVALSRHHLDLPGDKLEQWTSPDLLSALRPEPVDAVFCCLGTTIRTAGSQAAFRRVDHDLVIGLGNWAKTNGVNTFCVVSAIGADAGSGIFYNRVKGEMERDLKAIGLPALHIFQPSILTGPRKEMRLGERIGIPVMQLLAPLMGGNWSRYRPMRHDTLAQAMINAATIPASGTHAYSDIMRMAGA